MPQSRQSHVFCPCERPHWLSHVIVRARAERRLSCVKKGNKGGSETRLAFLYKSSPFQELTWTPRDLILPEGCIPKNLAATHWPPPLKDTTKLRAKLPST